MSSNFMSLILVINLFSINFTQDINSKNNSTHFLAIWDMFNIPESVQNINSIEEILATMASGKHRSCKASVLYHPFKKIYYFKNPIYTKSKSNPLKHYLPMKCREIKSRTASLQQRFFLSYRDIEQIVDNNEDSILTEGIHEITNLKKGFEISLFPVKFNKGLVEENYNEQKQLICYDNIKVLGIDKYNNDYFIISASDKHKIIYCGGYESDTQTNLNNFIRYSSYCDEFCSEDYIYFSNDLIKCKCDFYNYVDDFKKNKNNLNNTDCFYYGRKLDRYEIFANPYEITEKINKHDELNKPHYRYYLHLIAILFTCQVLYAFYFIRKNSLFIKITVIFYIILSILIYVPQRLIITYQESDFIRIFEIISDLYPILLLICVACEKTITVKDCKKDLTNIINNKSNNGDSENDNEFEIIKISIIIFMNSLDHILRETRVNEFELTFRFITVLCTFTFNNNTYVDFFISNVRIKLIAELISRIFLYMVEKYKFDDIMLPLYIIAGRPRDNYITSDHLLFQSNYLKLKPFFEKFYENWFMEALNFHKLKNMILFLKFARYSFNILLLSIIFKFKELNLIISELLKLNFRKALIECVTIAYKILFISMNFNFTSKLMKYFHIPIFLALLFINVFLTKDSFKIFASHVIIGALVFWISKNDLKKKKMNYTSSIGFSSSGLHEGNVSENNNF